MILIPIKSEDHKHDMLIVILNKANVDRMKVSDPAEIQLSQLKIPLVLPTIMIAYEDSSPEFSRIVQGGNVRKIIEFLQRGWEFKPEKGDNDNGPQSIKEIN